MALPIDGVRGKVGKYHLLDNKFSKIIPSMTLN